MPKSISKKNYKVVVSYNDSSKSFQELMEASFVHYLDRFLTYNTSQKVKKSYTAGNYQ